MGYRLQVDELATELGMSPTPIREALRLLQADRLVHYEPHRGVVVARHSPEKLSDVYAMRMALEPLATRLAIEHMTDELQGELQTIHQNFLAAGRAGRGKRMAQLNSAWHLAIYQAAGSDMLQDFTGRLWDVFPWRTNWAVEQRTADSMREHDEVMDAVRRGDAQAGADAMFRHIRAGSASEQPELSETEQ
ncbi:transcriptional regulator, GntR family [Pseudonocardia sp. N23]|nr:transcriptional regulator, GntR family [Pseudonocardia sp. N23]